MSASSIHSATGTIASIKKMAHNSKPDMNIVIDNHDDGKVYSTFDALSGRAEITAPFNARFDQIQITLEGTIKTFVENLSPYTTRARTTAVHNFLKMTMPVPESSYPHPRIAEAGRTYSFPFNFVIPDQLLPRACSHECSADYVNDAHLQLPPSMGDRELSGLDDLAPEMTKVEYAVKVRVMRTREIDGKDVLLVEGRRKLRIVPVVKEAPPMTIGNEPSDYVLAKSKALRKGMFSGKLGKITVSAAQPSALVIPSPSSLSTTPPTTMATVQLRFDPHNNTSEPPRLGGLTTKIKISSFYAARPAREFPSHITLMTQYESIRGVYDTSLPLSSRCVEAVAWEKHSTAPAYTRRNSASSSSSSDCSDPECSDSKQEVYYTAQIVVPITLPTNKEWIPTFHSCIVSRVYMIEMTLTIHTPGTGVPATSAQLRLPVQIAADGNNGRRATLTPEEAAAELADADEYLRPRIIEVPAQALVGNSVLTPQILELPPSYEHASLRQPVVGRS
jgi:hypothetical protein